MDQSPTPPETHRYYEDWIIVDELSYMSPVSLTANELMVARRCGYYPDYTTTDVVELDEHASDHFINELDEINKQTTEDIKKIKEKLEEIELSLKKDNITRYIDNDGPISKLSTLDKLLGDAAREVVEMKRGASTAVVELTKSVANVDTIIDHSYILRDASNTFRKSAYDEKKSYSISLKMKLLVVALVAIAAKCIYYIITM